MAMSKRQPAAVTRERIIDAVAEVLVRRGARGLNVRAVMQQAEVSRTAFYVHFADMHAAVAAVIDRMAAELDREAADWFDKPDAVGSRDEIYQNALRAGRSEKSRAKLACAIVDAAGMDDSLRSLWRSGLIQGQIDATAAAIRRDQAAGAVRPGLDPDATALALTLMGEQLSLELFGRGDAAPEQYAAILAPIWEAVLFGPDDDN